MLGLHVALAGTHDAGCTLQPWRRVGLDAGLHFAGQLHSVRFTTLCSKFYVIINA